MPAKRRSHARRAPKRRRASPAPGNSGHALRLTVNGTPYASTVESRTLLVDFLRDHLRLTGTHVGCDTSHCGACTVLVDGHAVKSCTLFALQVDGAEVTTIEGLSDDGHLHPVQAAFKQYHGLQCGFCTPGMVLATVDLLHRNPHPSEDEIRTGISGNLCRCTGYVNIVRAVQAASAGDSAGGGR